MSATDDRTDTQQHAGLQDFFGYPLADALQDRRTRRVAQGTSLEHGAQPYTSSNPPSPLTPLEEAILIASTSVTGAVMHDGPTQKTDGSPELGTMFLEVAGRAASSADNAQATSFFMINDEGIWLISRPRGRQALELFTQIPPRWEDRTEDDWLSFAGAVKRKVYDGRFSFPEKQWPYFLGWNGQMTNAPGTTCFLPIVDNTRQYINVLLILLSRAARQGAAVHRRLVALQAQGRDGVGGLGGGQDRPRRPDPLPADRRHQARARRLRLARRPRADRLDHDGAHRLRGALPAAEPDAHRRGAPARRLGPRRADDPPRLGARPRRPACSASASASTAPRTSSKARFKRWPPVPASQPAYVGIDGVLEGLCPPYVNDMDAAVDQVLEEKFGPGGTYTDAEVFAQSYKDQAAAETYMKAAGHPSAEAIAYTKEICRYLVDTYGRFPAHTDPFHLPGVWVQFSHLEIEYYEQYASPRHVHRQAEGRAIWKR